MIERFLGAGHHVGWVTGDEVYDGNPKLPSALEERDMGYVLAGARSTEVATGAGKFCADALAAKLPRQAWQKPSAGQGAKGQRFYDWALIDLVATKSGGRQLLIRRNRATGVQVASGANLSGREGPGRTQPAPGPPLPLLGFVHSQRQRLLASFSSSWRSPRE